MKSTMKNGFLAFHLSHLTVSDLQTNWIQDKDNLNTKYTFEMTVSLNKFSPCGDNGCHCSLLESQSWLIFFSSSFLFWNFFCFFFSTCCACQSHSEYTSLLLFKPQFHLCIEIFTFWVLLIQVVSCYIFEPFTYFKYDWPKVVLQLLLFFILVFLLVLNSVQCITVFLIEPKGGFCRIYLKVNSPLSQLLQLFKH